MPLQKFRLLFTSHDMRDENGLLVRYRKDQIIETEQDLCAMFPNKFENLSAPKDDALYGTNIPEKVLEALPSQRKGESKKAPPELPLAEIGALEAAKKKRKEAKVTLVEQPETVDEVDDDDEDDEDVLEDDRVTIKSKLGTDVTDEFPEATELDLAVVKKGNNFFIVDPAAPDEAKNKKSEVLTSRKMVQKFIEKLKA